jgi:hypothetical protein
MFMRSKFAARTNLAVSSMEYCDCLFDEGDIWILLDGGGGHKAMIPPLCNETHISSYCAGQVGVV